MISSDIKGNDNSIVVLLNIILYSAILRSPLDFYLSINVRVITMIIYIIVFTYIIFNFDKLQKRINIFAFFLIVYFIIRLFIEVVFLGTDLMQPVVSFVKLGSFIMLVWLFLFKTVDKQTIIKLLYSIIVFFVITTFISYIQYNFELFGNEIFLYYGGNYISGTALGTIRATGGIGGTAIDYAVFISLNIILFFTFYSIIKFHIRIVYFVTILISMFLNYSRITFLISIILALSFIFVILPNKKVYKTIFLLGVIFSFGFYFYKIDNQLISYIFLNDEYRMRSDKTRVLMWISSINSLDTPIKILIGASMGQNTGIPMVSKNVADGHFFSFLGDYGAIGLFMYLSLYISVFFKWIKKSRTVSDKIFILTIALCIFIINVINSGFEHYINLLLFSYITLLFMNKYRIQNPNNNG